MEIKLLDHTKLSNAVIAGRTAYQSFHKGGNYDGATDDITDVDKEFLNWLFNKQKHESVLEMVTYVFKMDDFSRAVLQQWSRNRIMSQTVMSTRYIKPKKFKLYKTDNEELNEYIQNYFDGLIEKFGHLSNDVIKYGYPEAVLTKNVVTFNFRELNHILTLRLSNHAFKEYQELARMLLNNIPEKHKFLFEESFGQFIEKEEC